MTKTLTILAADDVDMNRRLLTRIVERLGHTIMLVENGQEAVDFCRTQIPDLILMDVMMPVMDGFEATRQIRTLLGERWIPIIFLTAKAEQDDLLEGLKAGGDDYLTKPIDVSILTAKINVMARIADLQQRVASDAVKLAEYYRNNEAEQDLAKHVLHSLTDHSETEGMGITQWLQPAVNFSGDVIAVARAPTGVVHVMLADSTGHGLSAAISCLPAVTSFYSMTEKGFAISAIAREINQHLHRSLPLGRFVAAIIASIDHAERIVSVWNGGIPSVLMVNRQGKLLRRFDSKSPPLGVMANDDFDPSLTLYRWHDDASLIMCSDGLTEARAANGDEFGEMGILNAIAADPEGEPLETVRRAVLRHLDGEECHDDLSILVVPCIEQSASIERSTSARAAHTELANWEIKLTFGPRQLREDNCMPALLGWLNQIGLDANQFGEVLLVLTELFNNALDHGILRLPSELKSAGEGFQEYMSQRQERLQALESGLVEIGMVYQVDSEQAILRLWVRDSGPGFDLAKVERNNHVDDARQTHGRGIPLVQRLCKSVRWMEHGNLVEAEYQLH
ncbi:SpoIIE family protein phosphatase [Burkholderiaceae bacterium DAT-1]|nr:SpoIIE family protein phosphatase [Burkholderiaceae bacterium DAT-1]